MHRRLAFLLSFVAAIAACKSLNGGAKEEFGRAYSCPDDRVTSVERPDIPVQDVLDPMRNVRAVPPPDVAADAGRLAKWQSDREEMLAQRKHMYDDYEIHDVSGCGHSQLMACHHPIGRKGGAQINNVQCQIVVMPAVYSVTPNPPPPPPPPPPAPVTP